MNKIYILKINSEKPDIKKIKIASEAIKKGKLVAFPTETVYGLGTNAFNPEAVSKIFEVKGRPFNDPLIVHIAEKNYIFKLAKEIPEEAIKLIDKFWPGPLTLVLKKSKIVPDIVTAGLETVAIRMPKNKIALSLIKYARTPIVAPSANIFGKPSPTCAKHVVNDLDGKVDIILDGGKTEIGVESTVIDMTQKPFRILRPGGVTVEEIEKLLHKVEIKSKKCSLILSPGMLKHHYSPEAKLLLFEKNKRQISKMKKLALKLEKQGKKVGILTTLENKNKFNGLNIKILGSIKNLRDCASKLFSVLREFDREKFDIIIAEGIRPVGLGLTIMDRLKKAADKKI
ncbi:MAG: L-threonylcarbamoyladenylate synthase [Endomicrobiia bacterium]